MATQVMITDPEMEQYLEDVAKANGGMGRATAARFIIAEHKRMNSSESTAPASQANGKEQPAETTAAD
jgi:hypothetical protein